MLMEPGHGDVHIDARVGAGGLVLAVADAITGQVAVGSLLRVGEMHDAGAKVVPAVVEGIDSVADFPAII